jgi:hypothetical protein
MALDPALFSLLGIYYGPWTPFGTSGPRADTINGGTGNDDINGLGGNDTLNGNGGHDRLNGGDGTDRLDGGVGTDQLFGGQGLDFLNGGDGNDYLEGGGGIDQINGGAGNDTASYESSPAGVTMILLAGAGTGLGGDATGDILTGIENVVGSNQIDTITGDNLANVLAGLKGDDTLNGGAGADTLIGGAGYDTMNGGGADGVQDTFLYENLQNFSDWAGDVDTIDFETGIDKLDLHLIDANSVVAGNQDFKYIGSYLGDRSHFSGDGGELQALIFRGRLWIDVDIDGDRERDFRIGFVGEHTPNIEGDDLIL